MSTGRGCAAGAAFRGPRTPGSSYISARPSTSADEARPLGSGESAAELTSVFESTRTREAPAVDSRPLGSDR
eukprot:2078038-Prymnesium_polylepis.1